MTVSELIQKLSEYDENATIYLDTDFEQVTAKRVKKLADGILITWENEER